MNTSNENEPPETEIDELVQEQGRVIYNIKTERYKNENTIDIDNDGSDFVQKPN